MITFEEAIRSVEAAGQDAAPDVLPRLIGEVERVKASLYGRLAAASVADLDDELLKVGPAAAILNMSPATLTDKANRYPFTVRNGRSLRFSRRGIRRWIAGRTA